jgi:putative Holliday junction resolvase
MNILGVDLGQKTTGLAISQGTLATPYGTLKHQSAKQAVLKIAKICEGENIQKLVVGYVEGKIKSYFQSFVKNFKAQRPQIEVILWDETLTTRQAREYLIKLQVPKTKRGQKEHEVAAAIILQSYLDSLCLKEF